ncbi:MAG: O-antigen ligase family protein [Bdellovibrionota bacterium]|nr:O-antigen ligase family protein [Bdellovibrionota bacterium]
MTTKMHKVTIAALFVLSLGIFSSVSFSAVSHVLMFISGLYFTILAVKENNLKFGPSFYALVMVVISIVLSVVFNLDIIDKPLKNIFKSKYFIIPLLGVSSFYYLVKSYSSEKLNKYYKNLILLFIGITSLATISGLIALYTGFNPVKLKGACHESRACGLYGMYMTYGYGISFFMTLNLGAILFKNKFKHLVNPNILYLSFLINFLGLYFSFERGAWLGFFGSIPFFFFFKSKKTFLLLILAGLIGSAATFTLSEKVRGIFTNRSESNDQRIAFYQTAIVAFKESPLFGIGYRNFEPNVKKIKQENNIKYPEFGGHAHNNFLEHLASTGSFGVIALILFCLLWLYEAKSFPIVFAFIFNFLLSGQVQYTFGDGENLFLIMTVWLITSSFYKLHQEGK